MTKSVNDPSAEYMAALPIWETLQAVRDGTLALRAGGERWLPREPAESVVGYGIRLNRTFMTAPGFANAIQQFTDKVFQKPVVIDKDGGQLGDIMDDTDGLGNNITVFARQVFQSALQNGLTNIQIGYPDARETLQAIQDARGVVTLADAEMLALRPFLIHRPAPSVIGWRGMDVGGRMEIERVRIRETYEAPPTEEWDDDTAAVQVRVLGPGYWQIWRAVDPKTKSGRAKIGGKRTDWAMVDGGITDPLTRVPMVSIYFDDAHGFMVAKPPLEQLAQINLCHWQSSSDQRTILKIARVPLLFGRGFTPEEVQGGLTIAVSQATFTSNPTAELGWVEHGGTAIEAGQRDLENLEAAMSAWTQDFLAREPQAGIAATSKAIDDAQTHSMIQALAAQTADGINAALDIACEWVRAPAGSVRVSIDVESLASQILGAEGEGGGADPVGKMAANAR